MLVGVSHHPGDAGQGSDLIRRALGVAPGNKDPGVRVLAMNLSYRSTSVMICRRGHGTRVQDYNICMGGGFGERQTF
jgi:hypothetical protein